MIHYVWITSIILTAQNAMYSKKLMTLIGQFKLLYYLKLVISPACKKVLSAFNIGTLEHLELNLNLFK
jgi:hypothetical protein